MSNLERYPVQYDDLFVFAPSFAAWEACAAEGLTEGKYVGAVPEQDIVLLDKDRTIHAFLHPEQYAQERKVGVTVGKRKLKHTQDALYPELFALVTRADKGRIDGAEFKRDVVKLMRRAWRDAFLAGIRSTGIQGRGHGVQGVELEPDDERWFKGAMKHEMRFLNRFVGAVLEGTYKMPLDRRTRMYVDALESFYDSARVIGLPATSVLRWTGKKDKRVCASCRYLRAFNPYHKKTLPTVPRAGLTLCLTNCRDRLLVRVVSSQQAIDILQGSPYSREEHVRNLLEIKRLGQMPPRLERVVQSRLAG